MIMMSGLCACIGILSVLFTLFRIIIRSGVQACLASREYRAFTQVHINVDLRFIPRCNIYV